MTGKEIKKQWKTLSTVKRDLWIADKVTKHPVIRTEEWDNYEELANKVKETGFPVIVENDDWLEFHKSKINETTKAPSIWDGIFWSPSTKVATAIRVLETNFSDGWLVDFFCDNQEGTHKWWVTLCYGWKKRGFAREILLEEAICLAMLEAVE